MDIKNATNQNENCSVLFRDINATAGYIQHECSVKFDEKLGKGVYGTVYKAKISPSNRFESSDFLAHEAPVDKPISERTVAVKLFNKPHDFKFKNEREINERLSTPPPNLLAYYKAAQQCVVKYHGYIEENNKNVGKKIYDNNQSDNGSVFGKHDAGGIIYELVNGISLEKITNKESDYAKRVTQPQPTNDNKNDEYRPLSANQKFFMLSQATAGLAYMHECGCEHNDAHWGNFVWNSAENTLKVIDFSESRQEIRRCREEMDRSYFGSIVFIFLFAGTQSAETKRFPRVETPENNTDDDYYGTDEYREDHDYKKYTEKYLNRLNPNRYPLYTSFVEALGGEAFWDPYKNNYGLFSQLIANFKTVHIRPEWDGAYRSYMLSELLQNANNTNYQNLLTYLNSLLPDNMKYSDNEISVLKVILLAYYGEELRADSFSYLWSLLATGMTDIEEITKCASKDLPEEEYAKISKIVAQYCQNQVSQDTLETLKNESILPGTANTEIVKEEVK